jgi:hypothetical protein
VTAQSAEVAQGFRSTCVTHWAMWFPLPMAWNGSQNAGKLASCPAAARWGSNATIQSCAFCPASSLSP